MRVNELLRKYLPIQKWKGLSLSRGWRVFFIVLGVLAILSAIWHLAFWLRYRPVYGFGFGFLASLGFAYLFLTRKTKLDAFFGSLSLALLLPWLVLIIVNPAMVFNLEFPVYATMMSSSLALTLFVIGLGCLGDYLLDRKNKVKLIGILVFIIALGVAGFVATWERGIPGVAASPIVAVHDIECEKVSEGSPECVKYLGDGWFGVPITKDKKWIISKVYSETEEGAQRYIAYPIRPYEGELE